MTLVISVPGEVPMVTLNPSYTFPFFYESVLLIFDPAL